MTRQPVAGSGTILRLLDGIEATLLCLLLVAMIVLACLQIVLRSLFATGLLWADPLLQQLVLWSGLLGAATATARGKHIAVDLAAYLVPPLLQPWIALAIDLFSSLTAAALVYASTRFVTNELAYGGPGLFALPSWAWNLIFPLAFGLIALRSAIALGRDLGTVLRRDHKDGR